VEILTRMLKDCWIKSKEAKKELKELFSDIDKTLSEILEEAPHTPETSLDGKIGILFEERSKPHLRRFNDVRESKGLCKIQISVKSITHTESKNGADIGLVADINIPEEINLRKAVLVQSKRLHPNNEKFNQNSKYNSMFYDEETHLDPQWKRMQKVSCSSFYFLYGPYKLKIGRTQKILGTRIIDANLIAGKAKANVKTFSAEDSFDYGKPFSDWIVDQFLCCKVGDTREEVIKIALGNDPQNFPVHDTLFFTIKEQEISKSEIK